MSVGGWKGLKGVQRGVRTVRRFLYECRTHIFRMELPPYKDGFLPYANLLDILHAEAPKNDIQKFLSIWDTKCIEARYPWVTISDLYFYQEGWKSGVAFCGRMIGSCTPQGRNQTSPDMTCQYLCRRRDEVEAISVDGDPQGEESQRKSASMAT